MTYRRLHVLNFINLSGGPIYWRRSNLKSVIIIVKGKHEVLIHKPPHFHSVGLKNHLEKVLSGVPQTMKCTICHVNKQVQSSNNTICECKSLLTYNPTHDITFKEKHIDNEHEAIVAKYVLHHKNEDETSNSSREKCENYKRATPFTITEFFFKRSILQKF